MVMFATFSLGYFFIYQSGCILVFLMGVMLPIVFVIVHASLRLRNLKNKVIFRKITSITFYNYEVNLEYRRIECF